ncbi:hypothetical protein K438DRAFT_1997499 [Mycena galopus ATCC 62051]|nr:hypothetical protein K438DRAFT_1997499 [Mycena galopus ATCC 62051]
MEVRAKRRTLQVHHPALLDPLLDADAESQGICWLEEKEDFLSPIVSQVDLCFCSLEFIKNSKTPASKVCAKLGMVVAKVAWELPSNDGPYDPADRGVSTTLIKSPFHADTYEIMADAKDRQPGTSWLMPLLSWAPFNLPSFFSTKTMITESHHNITFPTCPSKPPQLTFKSILRSSASRRLFGSKMCAVYKFWEDPKGIFVMWPGTDINARSLELPLPVTTEAPETVCLTHSDAVMWKYKSKVVVSHYQ